MMNMKSETLISIIAIVISSFTLGWTVYRDFIKPRSKTTGMTSFIKHGTLELGPFISISIVNMGPGKIIIKSIVAKAIKKGYYTIMHDWENDYCPNLPCEVQEYDDMTQFIKIEGETILDKEISKLGFCDSLGRYHWMRRKDLKRIKKEYSNRGEERDT